MEIIERTMNTNDTATQTVFTLGLTDTVIAVANSRRIFFEVGINCASTQDCVVHIGLRGAGADTFEGMPIFNLQLGVAQITDPKWRMEPDQIYTGEIVATASVGTPDIHVTEF